jgi:hypothetical protein
LNIPKNERFFLYLFISKKKEERESEAFFCPIHITKKKKEKKIHIYIYSSFTNLHRQKKKDCDQNNIKNSDYFFVQFKIEPFVLLLPKKYTQRE